MALSLLRRKKNVPPDNVIEVVDGGNKPLLLMPERHVLRQNLRHRAVIVCLRNLAGDIFLHKRPAPDKHGELWSLAASCRVLAGESRHAAAERCLEAEQGIRDLELIEVASIPSSPATRNAEATLFLTARTSAIPQAGEGVFVDREELRAILRDFPHMVTPFLSLAAPYIYPAGNRIPSR
ncbi:NUDIX domain-containing protein [Desulfovibrio sp. OttesenSCG-928-O18]|nr:NUDIX domain-containing protein [Desulfovibrio sp. OttesenSCG-928-O18]